MAEDPPLCSCHGEPMGWQRDVRMYAGGYWECKEKRRRYNKARIERIRAWENNAYATNPKYRAKKRLSYLRRVRRRTLEELEQLAKEVESLGLKP